MWLLTLHSSYAHIYSSALDFKHARRLSVGIVTNHGKELKRCTKQYFTDRSDCGIGYVGTLVVFPMVSGFIGHLVSRWSVADQ